MKLSAKTWALALLASLLLVVNLVGETAEVVEPLPSLSAFAIDDATRVRISTPVDAIELVRTSPAGTPPEEATWEITTPLQFGADAAQIRALLRDFGPGVTMEARVDEGNLEDYAVDDQNGKLLEIFTTGDEPTVSVTIGKTAAGGTTFVRITGAEAVYRADVGGRMRFDRPAADWRDKMALDVDRAKVTALRLVRDREVLAFTRGPSETSARDGTPLPGPWTLPGAPFPIDDEAVESIVRGLSRLRAGEIHNPDFPGGFETPAATATLTMADGGVHTVVVGGAATDDAAFVKVDDGAPVFRVTGQVRRAVTQPVTALRDRSLLRFEREALESVSLVDGGLTVVLTQGEGGTWSITQPPNMDTDERQALFTVNTLATLRAFDVAPDEGFAASGARFVLRFRDGRTESLDIGQPERDADNQPLIRVRASGRPGVYRMKASSLAELRKAFGRG